MAEATATRPETSTSPARDRRTIPAPLLITTAISGAVVAGAAAAIQPVIALGVVLGVCYALVVLERPLLGVYACYALVPVTAGLRRGLPVPSLKFSEVLLAGTFFLVVGIAGLTRKWSFFDRILLLFVVSAATLPLVSSALLGTPVNGEAFRKISAPLLFVMLFRLGRVANFDERQRWTAVKLLFLGTIPVVAVALGQVFNVPGVRSAVVSLTRSGILQRWSYVEGGAARRATGLLENWHALAGYMLPLFLVALALLSQTGTPRAWRRLTALTACVTLVGVTASQTLTILAALIGSAILIGVIQRQALRTVVTLFVLFALALTMSGNTVSARIAGQFEDSAVGENLEDRLDIWADDYADPLREYWSTGYGPELPSDVEWRSTESLYVTLMLRGGFLLVGAYLVMTAALAMLAWDARRSSDPLIRAIGTGLFAVSLASLFMHLTFPYLTSTGFPQVLWLLAGLLPAERSVDRSSHVLNT